MSSVSVENKDCCSLVEETFVTVNVQDKGEQQKSEEALKDEFGHLNSATIQSKYLDFETDEKGYVTMQVPAVHCQSCVYKLEQLPLSEEGILSAKVNFLRKELVLSFDKAVLSLSDIAVLLSKIGFTPILTTKEERQKVSKSEKQQLIIYLAVVGFCFGNIMLLSFPDYVGGILSKEGFLFQYFDWIATFLSLPVLWIASKVYGVPAWSSVKKGTIDMNVPIVIGMLSLFILSIVSIWFLSGESYLDSFAGLIFFLLVGKIFQYTTQSSINFEKDFKSHFPVAVQRVIDEGEQTVSTEEVAKGDTLRIRSEEIVPCDAVALENGRLDYSLITGESLPEVIVKGGKIQSGGKVVGKSMLVTAMTSASSSELMRLWENASAVKSKQMKLSLQIDKVARYFTFTILVVAALTLAYWAYVGQLSFGLYAFSSVLIIACPCALAMAIPFTYGNIIRRFSKLNFFIKDVNTVEALSRINHVVFDKTGTLTDQYLAKIKWVGSPLSEHDNDAINAIVKQSNHPLSLAVQHYLDLSTDTVVNNFKSVDGKGLSGEVNGGVYQLGSASYLGISPFKYTHVGVMKSGQLLGHFKVTNSYRKGIEKMVAQLQSLFTCSVLSGDQASESATLKRLFGAETSILFQQSPEDKRSYIQELQSSEREVMMIGDGVNDAMALLQSDVGVAVVDKVGSFSPASKAIIDASSLQYLDGFIRVVRLSKRVIWGNFFLSFVYNGVGLYFAVQGLLSPIVCAVLMPISSLSVILFSLITTNLLTQRITKKVS